jgi:thiamine kinase-like enzyme
MVIEVDKADQEAKKVIVLQEIVKICKSSKSNKALTKLRDGIDVGRDLSIQIVSGGLTNYSYKIYLKEDAAHALYAKLAFEHTVFDQEKTQTYDLERTVNECKMMDMFSKHHSDMVATPLGRFDIKGKDGKAMKLMVTEWCENDEQLANQFIEGMVDLRLAPKMAAAMATLHTQPFDPQFNAAACKYVLAVWEGMREEVDTQSIPPEAERKATRTETRCQELGRVKLNGIVDASLANFCSQECLVHNDYHAFNMIVELKPSCTSLETFGSKGSITIVDWEMAMVSSAGRDVGLTHCFPSMCAIAHALAGHQNLASNIIEFNNMVWGAYDSEMRAHGKDENDLGKVFCDALGCVPYYCWHAHIDHLNIDCESGVEYVRDCVGYIWMTLMSWAFGGDVEDDETLVALRTKYNTLMEKEISAALLVHPGRCRGDRRASMLRASGRRVSDAPLTFRDAARLSISHNSSNCASSIASRISVVMREVLLEEAELES